MSSRYLSRSTCLSSLSVGWGSMSQFGEGQTTAGPKHTARLSVVILFTSERTATRFKWSNKYVKVSYNFTPLTQWLKGYNISCGNQCHRPERQDTLWHKTWYQPRAQLGRLSVLSKWKYQQMSSEFFFNRITPWVASGLVVRKPDSPLAVVSSTPSHDTTRLFIR